MTADNRTTQSVDSHEMLFIDDLHKEILLFTDNDLHIKL